MFTYYNILKTITSQRLTNQHQGKFIVFQPSTLCFSFHKKHSNHKSLHKVSLITSHRWDLQDLHVIGTPIFSSVSSAIRRWFKEKASSSLFLTEIQFFLSEVNESSLPASIWVVSWGRFGFKNNYMSSGYMILRNRTDMYRIKIPKKLQSNVQNLFALYCSFSKVFLVNFEQYCTNM